jgi:uncharacterized protein (TIGR03382 family)
MRASLLSARPGLCVSALACALTSAPAIAAVTITPIALTNTDGIYGPGMGSGVTFSTIDQHQPSINNAGQVAFRGNSSMAGTPQGVWIRTGTANANIAIAGGTAPGGGTYTAGTSGIFNSMHINNAGRWAFRLGGSTANFTNGGGTPVRALSSGDVAPGTGGATVSSLQTVSPMFNDAGDVGVLADLTTGSGSPAVIATGATANSRGLWKTSSGVSTLIARQNDTIAALDATGNVRLGQIQNLTTAMNDNGRFAFVANVQGTGVVTGNGAGSNSVALFSDRNGSVEVIARVGSAAPTATGTPSSTDLFRNLGTSAFGFNNQGRVAFVASLRDAAGTQTSTASLFTDTGSGVLREIARNGAALPAITGAIGNEFTGVTWGTVSSSPRMNSQGTLAIQSSLGNVGTGGSNIILTMSSSDVFTRIARTGDIAIVNGAPFGGDALFNTFSNLTINANNQLAFTTLMSGNGISGGPGGNNSALFTHDPVLGLCLIARTADPFTVAPGDVRTISTIGGITQSGGQDGRTSSLSDNGTLAFQLTFTDGSAGIFVATVPTAGTLPVLALAALGLVRRRR